MMVVAAVKFGREKSSSDIRDDVGETEGVCRRAMHKDKSSNAQNASQVCNSASMSTRR